MIKKIGLAILAGAFAAGSAFAAEFSEVDTDADGTISAEEAQAAGMEVEALDVNQDGTIDEAEFAKFTEENKE